MHAYDFPRKEGNVDQENIDRLILRGASMLSFGAGEEGVYRACLAEGASEEQTYLIYQAARLLAQDLGN